MSVKNSFQKKYEELTFTDDFMFCKVLQNNPDLCEYLIELIIGKPVKLVTYPDAQKVIQITDDGKGVRLDVYVEGDNDTIYDIEMQTSQLSNLNKRVRYYQGMLDLNTIERGADYAELKKSYIIFLCKFDPFKKWRVKYTFQQTCQEDYSIKLGDDAYIIFINPMGRNEDLSEDMKALLSYLRGKVIRENSFIDKLDAAVQRAREKKEWRTEYMIMSAKFFDVKREARAEGRAEGRAEEKKEMIRNMLTNKNFTDATIMEITNISKEGLQKIKDELKE